MKNTAKIIGLIALTAVITFTTACESTGNADSTPAPEPNTITITDIDSTVYGSYENVGTFIFTDLGSDWSAGSSAEGMGKIDNGSVTIELWKNGKQYTGTGDFYVTFNPLDSANKPVSGMFYRTSNKQNISTGNTTIAFSKFEKVK